MRGLYLSKHTYQNIPIETYLWKHTYGNIPIKTWMPSAKNHSSLQQVTVTNTLGIKRSALLDDDGTSRAARSGNTCRVGQRNGTQANQALEKRFDDSLTGEWLRRDKYPGWR
jgi:hypothetical protein